MLSTLELRNIIESSFLPQRCQCTQATDRSLTVRVFDQATHKVDYTLSGIRAEQLTSSRAISNLIGLSIPRKLIPNHRISVFVKCRVNPSKTAHFVGYFVGEDRY
ncbi:MAG: DUF1652 domain-containing protein [Proteobacteria bacterium]|nr:MAG: DUF1652 domain-containing protein [Pseudomonadota bacterium]